MRHFVKKVAAMAAAVMMMSTMVISASADSYSNYISDSYQKFTYSGGETKQNYYVACTSSTNLTAKKRYVRVVAKLYTNSGSKINGNNSAGATASKVTRQCYNYAGTSNIGYAYHRAIIRKTTTDNSAKLSDHYTYVFYSKL